jgi:3-methyladenine DNA glycosylase AlkD
MAGNRGRRVVVHGADVHAVTRDDRVRETLAWLERRGTKRNREGMARYAITAPKVFGVSMATMRGLAKRLGKDHELAGALWQTGWFEARILASFVDEPERVTGAQMDRWANAFDNWAICDTMCFHLFDQTPHAWRKIDQWSLRKVEFVKRAAFALLASVALHDKPCPDAPFVRALRLIERASDDPRNFVKKGVSWALRSVGHRNLALHTKAVVLATRLTGSKDSTARWIGKDALRDLMRPAVRRRVGDKSKAINVKE